MIKIKDLIVFSFAMAIYFTFFGQMAWNDRNINNKIIKFVLGFIVAFLMVIFVIAVMIIGYLILGLFLSLI